MSIQSLVNEHKRLDEAIWKNPILLNDGSFLIAAKRRKLAIKLEISSRARKGDVIAGEYAANREWGLKIGNAVAA